MLDSVVLGDIANLIGIKSYTLVPSKGILPVGPFILPLILFPSTLPVMVPFAAISPTLIITTCVNPSSVRHRSNLNQFKVCP